MEQKYKLTKVWFSTNASNINLYLDEVTEDWHTETTLFKL